MDSPTLVETLARQGSGADAVYGTSMVKRGSVTSQTTMLPGTSMSPSATSPAMPSPLGMHDYSFASCPRRRPIEDPLALITTLLPAALLLLSQLGPAHLFSPPLALPSFDLGFKAAANSPPDGAPPLSDDRASVASYATSTSSLPFAPTAFSPAHSYSHELHAPSTISVPAVSVAAVWRVFSGFEWIAEQDKTAMGRGLSLDENDEDALVFDFPSILQGVADVLAVSAARRGVELVIGQVGSGSAPSPISTPGLPLGPEVEPGTDGVEKKASRELLVQADERAWSVVLIWVSGDPSPSSGRLLIV